MITIILDKGDIFPGQTIKGKIELVPDTSILINDIELSLCFTEEWNFAKSEDKNEKRNNKQCISLFKLGVNRFIPEGDNNLIHLDPILHLFPFELKLPDYLYPSFEYPKHNFSSFLRYRLYANLKSPYLKLSSSCLIFIYANSPKDNSKFTLEKTYNLRKWGMFGKGITKVNAYSPMKSFRFSDNIPIQVTIDNSLGKMNVNYVKINLRRKIIFKDNKNNFIEKYSCIDKVCKKIYKIEIKSGTKEILNLKFPLTDIPHNEFGYFDIMTLFNWTKRTSEFTPSFESSILSCQYFIRITIYFDSFVKKSDRPRMEFPIYIVHKINENNFIPGNVNINMNNIKEANAEEIRKEKENDFVIINKDLNNPIPIATPMSSHNRVKTINNNGTYIENMNNKNKINYNKPVSAKDDLGQMNQKNLIDNNPNDKEINNKIKENNNNFNIRSKTHIENNYNLDNKNNNNHIEIENNINSNNNKIIENIDEDEAPSCMNFNFNNNNNKGQNNKINENINKIDSI